MAVNANHRAWAIGIFDAAVDLGYYVVELSASRAVLGRGDLTITVETRLLCGPELRRLLTPPADRAVEGRGERRRRIVNSDDLASLGQPASSELEP